MAVLNDPKPDPNLNNPPDPANREGFSPVQKGDTIRVPWMDGRPFFKVELVTTDGYPRIEKDGLYHTIREYEKITTPMKMLGGKLVPDESKAETTTTTTTTTAPPEIKE